jgi:ubiquinol-cytochrome c reductase cytochrome b subunit
MFYLFIVDIFVLGYVGSQPVTDAIVWLGRGATFIYFATFLLLPFVSRWEEKRMRARGLPPELQALFDHRDTRGKWPHGEAAK